LLIAITALINSDATGNDITRSYNLTKNLLMVQAPGFIRGINLKLRSIASEAWQQEKI
jgi:hypothetical protein